MANELSTLEELGLSTAEAKVYLALLETGSALAGIIIKKTGLHRGTTYQVLQRLIEKGLVSSIIKGKKSYFEVVNPQVFLQILKNKEEKLLSILPDLLSKLKANREKQEVSVYSGVNGIKNVLEIAINEIGKNGEYYDFGVSGLFRDVMKEYWGIWQKHKRKHKIKSYVIFNEELKTKNPNLLKDYLGETRFHPKEYASITDTIIYKDTVILFIWTAKPPIGIKIKNKDNAESYRNQFRILWRASKK